MKCYIGTYRQLSKGRATPGNPDAELLQDFTLY